MSTATQTTEKPKSACNNMTNWTLELKLAISQSIADGFFESKYRTTCQDN